jgi:hypothetical protein
LLGVALGLGVGETFSLTPGMLFDMREGYVEANAMRMAPRNGY